MPVFACPKCNTPLQLPDQMAGKMFACPRCQQQLVIPGASSPPGGVQGGAPQAPAGPPPGSSEPARDRRPAPTPPSEDLQFQDDRPRRRNKGHQEQDVGTIAATSSSSSSSKPLFFGMMGALGCFLGALLICGPHVLLTPGQSTAAPGKTTNAAKADVMFVLDITGSMQFAINGVSSGIKDFVAALEKENLDVRVGLTVYRDWDPRFRSFNDREAGITSDPFSFVFGTDYFTKNVEEFKAKVSSLRADAGGDIPENGLEALQLASAKRVRDDKTAKVLILITDAPYKRTSTIGLTRDVLKRNGVRQVHLIVGELGDRGDPADPNMTRLLSDFQPLWDPADKKDEPTSISGKYFNLQKLADENPDERKKVVDEIIATFKKTIVEEAQRVAGVSSLTGGATVEFDKSQAYRLWIASALVFGLLAFGLAVALIAGQRLYLRQSMFTAGVFLKALVPLAAGLAAGFFVDLLFTSFEMPRIVGIILRTLGWTVVGAVIGISMAFFVPNLRLDKGLLGGTIGGVAGGLFFNLITLLTGMIGSTVLSILIGDIIGALVLGFCIGVMVALAEVAFRRWWLEVRYGAREVRTVTLGTAPVTVGSDERRATVVVNDVSALVMRYQLEKDRIVCEDLESGQRAELQAGDSRKIGNVTITVCSPETVTKTGLMLELSNGHKVPLSDGLPLTAEELPGLQSNSPDGTVAIVGKKPSDPNVLLLRNRSKQSWTVHDAQGGTRSVDPGLGLPLEPGVEINFGRVQGRLIRGGGDGGGRRR